MLTAGMWPAQRAVAVGRWCVLPRTNHVKAAMCARMTTQGWNRNFHLTVGCQRVVRLRFPPKMAT